MSEVPGRGPRRRILITGGCGFIGSHLVEHVLERWPGAEVVNLDLCTYAGPPENLAHLEGHPRYRLVRGDVADAAAVSRAFEGGVDVVVHAAAESHVDRSIADPGPFLRTNVLGTEVLLRAARGAGVSLFVQVSTDEVYGSIEDPTPPARPEDPLLPGSPYAASKASADLLALACHRTYGLPVVVTRCTNNYGPRQFPEKLLPVAILAALDGRAVPLYGDGLHQRDWLHVRDHAAGLARVVEAGVPGRTYHFSGAHPRPNRDVVLAVLAMAGRGPDGIAPVTDRLGHDRRYALDDTWTRRDLGWTPSIPFVAGLGDAFAWYAENRGWCERVLARARDLGDGGVDR